MCKRGDIYYLEFHEELKGKDKDHTKDGSSVQVGERPVLVVQNNTGNKFSPTVIIVSITSQMKKLNLPTHVLIGTNPSGLLKPSVVETEQVQTIAKSKLTNYKGHVSEEEMNKVDEAMGVSVGIEKKVSIIDISYIQKQQYKIERYKQEYDKFHDFKSKMVYEEIEDSLDEYCKSHNIDINKIQWRNDNIKNLKKVSC